MTPFATLLRWTGAALVAALLGTASPSAQTFGPYTADANTRVLLHFEDATSAATFANAGTAGDAQAEGNASAFPGSAVAALGQSLYLDNDAISDSSWAFIPDSDALDLPGDITLELWFNILSYGTDNTDHRFYPSMIWKNGGTGNHWSQGNYFAEVKGDTRYLSTGYFAPEANRYPSIQSTNDLIQPGVWYHATYIRSTEFNVIVQLVHNAAGELIYSAQAPFDPEVDQPNITDSPLFIGQNGNDLGDQSGWFDGFIDEVRVSDVVRPFEVPPVVTGVTTDAETRTVAATVGSIGTSDIASATLRYKVGATGPFQDLALTAGADNAYTAVLPDNPGTIVYYYLVAENQAGQRTTFPTGAEDAVPDYLSFVQAQAEDEVLAFDFEEGSGTPDDDSGYGHQVGVGGMPAFSTTAKVGTYAYDFNGDTDYLQIPSPVVGATGEYTFSGWFNVQDFQEGSSDGNWQFWVLKPEPCPDCWGEGTFALVMGALDAQDRRLTTRSWIQRPDESRGNVELKLDTAMDADTWYRVIVENRAAPAGDTFDYYLLFQLRNADDEVVETKYVGYNGMPLNNPNVPLRLGLARNRGTAGFDGLMDEVSYLNYSAGLIGVDAAPSIGDLTATANEDGSFAVSTEVSSGLGGAVTDVTLTYLVGAGGAPQSVALTETDGVYSATIPALDEGTVAYYYVSATNDGGFTTTVPAGALDEEPTYLSVANYAAMSTLVSLPFDDTAQDQSSASHIVNVYGDPTFAAGPGSTQALELDGVDDYLAVQAGGVGGSEAGFAFELTFNVDDFREGTPEGNWHYLVNKPNLCADCWGEQEFALLYGAYDDPNKYLSARFWNNDAYDGSQIDLQVPVSMETDTWYTGRVEVAPSGEAYVAKLQLLDASGSLLGEAQTPMPALPKTTPGLPIFLGHIGNRSFTDGTFEDFAFYNYPAFGITVDEEGGPGEATFALGQSYPNPATRVATVEFMLAEASDVTLEVYDVLGRKVATAATGPHPAGLNTVRIETADLADGTYVYRLRAGDDVATGRMTVVR